MKSAALFLGVIFGSLILSGCVGGLSSPAPTTTDTADTESNSAGGALDQKVGDTTKTGTITQAGTVFFLTEAGKDPLTINSYAVDLSQYVGQTVTVTGQFSGDELFVGSVE